MDAEIIAAGSELLTPFHQDTNSLFLTAKLNELGVEVRYKTIVGDDRGRLAAALRSAMGRAQLVIVTGGLGPTEDDVTREAAAEVLSRELKPVPAILDRIRERFARLGRSMPENNARQALVLEGADLLENRIGTAPGLWIEHESTIVILLPGPPRELRPLVESECMPRLERLAPAGRIRTRVLKVAGLPESEVDRLIAPIYKTVENPSTTILAAPGGIEVHFRARAATDAEAGAMADALADKAEAALGDHVFSTHGETLEEVVGMYLVMKQKTIAAAESCTGGLLSERLTRVPGSSTYFLGGAACYSNELKTRFAAVPASLIESRGAVSKEVAQALAEGIRARAGSSFGAGITGIAGPAGGTPEKPVGLVFIALADERGTEVREFRFPGDRRRVRWLASQSALEMIRRRIRE
jgi:competence/damage-inducible protein CinA-like protein